MKYFLFLTFFILSLNLQSQILLHFSGGLYQSSQTYTTTNSNLYPNLDSENLSSYIFNIGGLFYLDNSLYTKIDINLFKGGGRIPPPLSSTEYQFNQVNFAPKLGYEFPVKRFLIFAEIGGYSGINFNGKFIRFPDTPSEVEFSHDFDGNYKRFEFGLIASGGIGVDLENKIFSRISIFYTHFFPFTNYNETKLMTNDTSFIKNRGWGVGITLSHTLKE